MKSTNFFQTLGCYSGSLILLIFLLGWTSCHDDEIVTLPFSESTPSEFDAYRGNFELMTDNCNSSKYTIEISRVAAEDLNDPISDPQRVPKIYVSNLINTGRTPVVAEWDGSGFISTNQDIMVHQTAVQITARLQLTAEDELIVAYSMTTDKETTSCHCAFRKL